MFLIHTYIENSLRYLKTIKYQNFQKKSLLYSILNIPTFRQSVTASPERMQHRTQNNGFYGCKIEKFVRDLKNLSHSYLKQPLTERRISSFLALQLGGRSPIIERRICHSVFKTGQMKRALILPCEIKITTNYKISYFGFIIDRKSTLCL